jgi:hypothetical protein
VAYAYKAVDELLNPSDQKQNIFASDSGASQQAGSSQGQQGDVKTSTEGELGGSGGGNAPAAQTQAPVADESKSARAAVAANAGKVAQPKAFTEVQGLLQQRQTDLQKQADDYVTKGRQSQQYALGNNDYEEAIKGNAQKADSLRGLLGRQNINQVDDFKAGDIEVKDANLLNNEAGLKQLVGRGQDAGYSQGMAAFDVRALRRTPGFDNIVSMIQGQQQDLNKKAADYESNKRKEVEDYGTQQLTSAKEAAKKYLSSQSSSIDLANEAEAKAANARLQEYRKKGVSDAEKKLIEETRAQVAASYQQTDPRYARFVAEAAADPRKYLSVRNDYGRDDFVDAAEAQRFNSIMGLLGQSDVRGQARKVGDEYTYDKAALEKDLYSSTSSLRAKADKEQKAALNALIKDAQKRADADDSRRKGLNLTSIAGDESEAVRAGLDKNLMSHYSDSLLDPSKFITRDSKDLKAGDVYSKAEADRLNAIYKDLGLADRVQAGKYGKAGSGYTFDKKAYEKALIGILSNMQKANAKKDAHLSSPAQVGKLAIPSGDLPAGLIAAETPEEKARRLAEAAKYIDAPRRQQNPILGIANFGV